MSVKRKREKVQSCVEPQLARCNLQVAGTITQCFTALIWLANSNSDANQRVSISTGSTNSTTLGKDVLLPPRKTFRLNWSIIPVHQFFVSVIKVKYRKPFMESGLALLQNRADGSSGSIFRGQRNEKKWTANDLPDLKMKLPRHTCKRYSYRANKYEEDRS